MDKIEGFFHHISPLVIQLTAQRFEKTREVKYKDKEYSSNFATEGDFDNEELIKNEINKWFPEDLILAEETLSETKPTSNKRLWIVDPICGSSNFKNGIKFFCTNVALADNGKLIAACVIDHSRKEYIWSIGNSKIYIGDRIVKPEKRTKGIIVEVDLSALTDSSSLRDTSSDRIEKHLKLISFLLNNKNYYLSAFCTSLPFAYTALGRVDAYVNGFSKIWDVAAANFLVIQAGGIVTQLDGTPWNLFSNNVLAARDKNLHSELLQIIYGPTK